MSVERLYRSQSGEHRLMILRPHPVTFAPSLAVFILAAGIPVVLADTIFGGLPPIQNPLLAGLAVLCIATYYLCLWMFLFTQFVTFYLDVDVVTNQRIVHAVQGGLFDRSVSELDLARIQDVSSEVRGFIATMFNYGNVKIQTAGEEEHFTFDNIPDPHAVRERILDLSHSGRRAEGREIVGEALRQEHL